MRISQKILCTMLALCLVFGMTAVGSFSAIAAGADPYCVVASTVTQEDVDANFYGSSQWATVGNSYFVGSANASGAVAPATGNILAQFTAVKEGMTAVGGTIEVPSPQDNVNFQLQDDWWGPSFARRGDAIGVSFYVYFPDNVTEIGSFKVSVMTTDNCVYAHVFDTFKIGEMNVVNLRWSDLKMGDDRNGFNGEACTGENVKRLQIFQQHSVGGEGTQTFGYYISDLYDYNKLPGLIVDTPVLYGDINNDEKINSDDALGALKHVVKMEFLTGDAFVRGDVDGNGVINAIDALLIVKYNVHIISSFPVEA